MNPRQPVERAMLLPMTAPDDVQFMHGHPVPARDHATLLASFHLLLAQAAEGFPVRISPPARRATSRTGS